MDITDYGAIGQIAVAFAAGLVSFLSPCVLPLVPGYISIISGSSLDQLKARDKDVSLFRTVLLNSIMFIAGFSLTFILLGASATWIGQVLVSRMQLLGRIAGLILIVFGIHLLGIVKINALYQDKRFHNVEKPRGVAGAFVLGLAFAFGWTPCIGPILAGILTIASTKQTVTEGMFLLAVYSAGLGIPFLLTSLALNKFLSFYGRFKKHFHAVEVASGALVIAVGLLMVTGSLSRLATWFSFLNRFAL
ncbi:MAG: cytochrome C biogenesis protein [Acidobacteria bacterium]|nr:MAG: cytochrome C biogenesis protein [Acidobacteriota bacterium]